MTRDEALTLLRAHKADLADRFGTNSLALFGSTVRNQAREDSDIDILVEFEGEIDSGRYFGLQFYIEDLLGQCVDLTSTRTLSDKQRAYVETEAVGV